LPEANGHTGLSLRSPSAHMRSRYERQFLIASVAHAAAGQCSRKWRPEGRRGIPFAFTIVSKLQTPITNLDKH